MMKKILVLAILAMFSFVLFAVSAERDSQKDAQDAFDYMDENGIEYEVDFDGAVKELPMGAQLLTVDAVESFISRVVGTKTVTMESYAYAGFDNPTYRRLKIAGGLDTSGYTGYRYKFERYNPLYMLWGNFTKDWHCPGGSSSSSVSYCTQTDPSEIIAYGDYNEYTACDICEDNDLLRMRFGANLYLTLWIYVNGRLVPVTTYAGWQYATSDGTPPPYSPSSDLCDTPVMLENLCPYI
jgi:hypothetical protein